MKGIILAGGKGTRMYPMTYAFSKQLLPVYDKPMIYYPLSVLLLAGIRDILIITGAEDSGLFRKLLGDGSRIGINIQYAIQDEPRGLAESFIIGESFVGDDDCCLILGDNIFYGLDLTKKLRESRALIEDRSNNVDAVVFGYPVKNPRDFGVVELDNDNNVVSIEEKPVNPKSDYAVPGLYLYTNKVIEVAKNVKPSARGELEITAVNNYFLIEGSLKCTLFGRGFAWLDTGTPDGMIDASNFISTMQKRQGFYVSCIEEIAWRRGFINDSELRRIGESLKMTDYGKYILSLLK